MEHAKNLQYRLKILSIIKIVLGIISVIIGIVQIVFWYRLIIGIFIAISGLVGLKVTIGATTSTSGEQKIRDAKVFYIVMNITTIVSLVINVIVLSMGDSLAYQVCADESTILATPRTNEEQDHYCNLLKADVIAFSVIYLFLAFLIEMPTLYLARRYLKIVSSQSPSTILLISE